MPYVVRWPSTSAGQWNTLLGQQLHHHPSQQHYVGSCAWLITRFENAWLVFLTVKCPFRNFAYGDANETESSYRGGELVPTVDSGNGQKWKPMYRLHQWLDIQREVGSPDWSHKHEYVELPLRDKEPELEHWLSFLLNCALVVQAHGLSVGISRLHMFLMSIFQCLVQHTRCHLVGSSCWGDMGVSLKKGTTDSETNYKLVVHPREEIHIISWGAIQVLRNADGGGGGVTFSGKKHYEGIRGHSGVT